MEESFSKEEDVSNPESFEGTTTAFVLQRGVDITCWMVPRSMDYYIDGV